jgi:hypothetical protein
MVEQVIESTGRVGEGKIFVTDLPQLVCIRNRETEDAALRAFTRRFSRLADTSYGARSRSVLSGYTTIAAGPRQRGQVDHCDRSHHAEVEHWIAQEKHSAGFLNVERLHPSVIGRQQDKFSIII